MGERGLRAVGLAAGLAAVAMGWLWLGVARPARGGTTERIRATCDGT